MLDVRATMHVTWRTDGRTGHVRTRCVAARAFAFHSVRRNFNGFLLNAFAPCARERNVTHKGLNYVLWSWVPCPVCGAAVNRIPSALCTDMQMREWCTCMRAFACARRRARHCVLVTIKQECPGTKARALSTQRVCVCVCVWCNACVCI